MMRIFLFLLLLPLVVLADQLPTAETAVVGRFAAGPIDVPVRVDAGKFGALFASSTPQDWPAEVQVRQFFRNGGSEIEIIRIDPDLSLAQALTPTPTRPKPRGLGWIPILSDLGLLLVPELSELPTAGRNLLLEQLRIFAETQHFTLILDPPTAANTVAAVTAWANNLPTGLGFAALYYPQILVDPAAIGGVAGPTFPAGASGSVAARFAQNDAAREIWKSPAGTDATLEADGLTTLLTNFDLDQLNGAHVNGIRDLPSMGIVLWGARTLDKTNVENRYLAVARTKRWVAHNLRRSLTFAAFEENDPTLWASLRSSAESFLHDLFVRGAFPGANPAGSYFVRCDATTTSAADIQNHRANLVVGLALLAPATFYVEETSLQTLDPGRTPPLSQPILGGPVAGELTAFYSTAPGFHFTLEEAADLSAPSWLPGHRRPGDGSWKRVAIPLAGNQRFLRIRID